MRTDADLAEARAALARDLTGLANVLTDDPAPLVEQVLVDLARQWRAVRDLGSPRRWARDRLARASLRVPPVAAPAERDRGQGLVEVVRGLPALPRAVLVLHLVDGLDEPRVAEALGTSVGAVRAALAEAQQLVGAATDALVPQDHPQPAASPAAPDEVVRPAAVTAGADLFAPPWRRPEGGR